MWSGLFVAAKAVHITQTAAEYGVFKKNIDEWANVLGDGLAFCSP